MYDDESYVLGKCSESGSYVATAIYGNETGGRSSGDYFSIDGNFSAASYLIHATEEDKKWLDACIKKGEYVKKEDVGKPTLDRSPLIHGEYYYVEDTSGFWMIGKVLTASGDYGSDDKHMRCNATFISSNREFNLNESWSYRSIDRHLFRDATFATPEQKDWLDQCISEGKFIEKSEALRSKHKLVVGEYYRIEEPKYNFWVICKVTDNAQSDSETNILRCNATFIGNDNFNINSNLCYYSTIGEGDRKYKKAKQEEIDWLDYCIEKDKFFPKEDIPTPTDKNNWCIELNPDNVGTIKKYLQNSKGDFDGCSFDPNGQWVGYRDGETDWSSSRFSKEITIDQFCKMFNTKNTIQKEKPKVMDKRRLITKAVDNKEPRILTDAIGKSATELLDMAVEHCGEEDNCLGDKLSDDFNIYCNSLDCEDCPFEQCKNEDDDWQPVKDFLGINSGYTVKKVIHDDKVITEAVKTNNPSLIMERLGKSVDQVCDMLYESSGCSASRIRDHIECDSLSCSDNDCPFHIGGDKTVDMVKAWLKSQGSGYYITPPITGKKKINNIPEFRNIELI
jgi:hypothetical protein